LSFPEKVFITGLFPNSVKIHEMKTILDEAISLIETAGGLFSGHLIQRGRKPDKSLFIGKGKVQEINNLLIVEEVDLILFLNKLSNVQQRNLENSLQIKVIDRTRLILDIFALRAISLEGKLQVELAQLLYLLPRLTGKGVELSRLGGGIGTRGPGETKLETDRRLIKKRISIIKDKLKKVRNNKKLQRKRRKLSPAPIVSLVGYTSSGKSTLFNLLTKENTFVTKKLFSTLDTLVRKVNLKDDNGDYYFLLSDTVGFIRDMPEELLTAFYSTLEEIIESDIILLLSDISNPDHEDQISEVYKVLNKLDINKDKIMLVYNKIDNIKDGEDLVKDGVNKVGKEVYISAKNEIGIQNLKKKIFNKFFRTYDKFLFSVDKSDKKINNIEKWAIVTNKSYNGDKIDFEVLCDREKMLIFLSGNEEN